MPLDIEKIQALCFDVDGTLLDTDEQVVVRLTRLLKPFLGSSAAKTARRITMTLDTPMNLIYTLLDWIHVDAPLMTLLEKFQQIKFRKVKPTQPLIPGTRQSLLLLKEQYPLSVVTARGKRATDKFIAFHQLEAHFICVASGQTTVHTKPWQTVGVLSGFGDEKELSQAGADLVVDDVLTLAEVLLGTIPK
ncbi:MAG: HAD hydrolase-like protein [Anaerolineales bacterium]